MSDLEITEGALLGALAANKAGLPQSELIRVMTKGGVPDAVVEAAISKMVESNRVSLSKGQLSITSQGITAFLDYHAAIEEALNPTTASSLKDTCPSVPWLTQVRTQWNEAVSINYAVDPDALKKLLPPPFEPEIFKGTAWVQILMSSLEDMRPQGMPALFGVCFYQVSYRAAVQYVNQDGEHRRGGYFVKSDTNNDIMRAIGNKLTEFKFHDFGGADMIMAREKDNLIIGVDPHSDGSAGKVVGVFDTEGKGEVPEESVWDSLDDLHEPLVECYDAFGADPETNAVYILTIDRDPWNARFVEPLDLYCEYFDSGPLGNGAATFDSVLYLNACKYYWQPLRMEAF